MARLNTWTGPMDDAVEAILSFIKLAYDRDDDGLELSNALHGIFDELKDDLCVLIEYPYVDKVFRDSYYSYFSSKHQDYSRYCLRVALFAQPIREKDFRSPDKFNYLQENFLGYIVIRPTFPKILGRSLLSKKAIEDDGFLCCTFKENVAINGVKLDVSGFSHCSQDGETITCAETTIWSVMEYFGHKYADYKPTYPSKIVNVLHETSTERMIPSPGLSDSQISYALRRFGFGTYMYSLDLNTNPAEMERIISIYTDSGIPTIAILNNEFTSHAIVVIGHETDKALDFAKQKKTKIDYLDEEIDYIDYANIKKRFVIQDDNLAPYRLIDLRNPTSENYEDPKFEGCTIQTVVVPLYKKIYLEAIRAKKLLLAVLVDRDFGYKFDKNFVFKAFLTSSRSFKNHIVHLTTLDPTVKDGLLKTPMPKFIWCAEIYSSHNFSRNIAGGLIIVDATEPLAGKKDGFIFGGYPDKVIMKDGNKFINLQKGFKTYKEFKNNLQ
ncbi:hypothetical protein CPT03_08490 [Pedobacter ginsengisoli]|uniref:Uncharacterized protein n=1 Tax=Pedobacter ginsengisoli TaxID=363852 RepID=A0A2D1U4J9_9SPHI|nr:hypothetical protein [Pedobacter ginsengisoli]ATP56508.1 hypothetical protein CPT03_08490 [Pedobacter ginsengisoli]